MLDTPAAREFMQASGMEQEGRRRASNITPVNPVLRCVYFVLRWAFGEVGTVSGFTRSWRCRWQVDMRLSGGPVFGYFQDRNEAIRAEQGWLADNGFSVNR